MAKSNWPSHKLLMRDEDYLLRAIELARLSSEPVGCGTVLVRGGEVLAETFNSQRADNQATNHAEIKAVQQANGKLKSRTLDGAVVYCSCQPCAMCLAAFSLAKVERIVYAKTMKELFPDDPMANIDSAEFVKRLNFVPKLERIIIKENGGA